jgi:ABC-type transport system involved in multi-copper enzyme maturation permease subunit
MRLVPSFSLPLFSKELIEQSNRRRTFVIRTLYAFLVYFFMYLVLWQEMGWETSSLAVLGRGRNIFSALVNMQFFAIFAFLPGLACGVLTAEKERDTLAMLLLTKLGPWTIILEKLFSRLMPLALLLLVSLPLLAVAYSVGGVEPHMLVSAVWVLALTSLQVGSLAVLCSAWFRTTAGAFVGTYVIGFCLMILPAILAEMRFPVFYQLSGLVNSALGGMGPPGEALLIGFGPFVEHCLERWFTRTGTPTWNARTIAAFGLTLVAHSTPLWLSALVFLFAARAALWRRAFLQPKHRILRFFRWLDDVFHRLNQNRFTKGIVLVNDSVALPLFRPIAWRETKKKALGTTRYLVRFLLAIEPPVIIFLLIADIAMVHSNRDATTPGVVPNVLLWLITALALTVQSTGLIAAEKSKQTLDVLLSTPLTTQEIIRQKLAGVRKLTFVLWIPLLTVAAFDAWWQFSVLSYQGSASIVDGWLWFFLLRLTPLVVYPAVITWIGFHFGLRLRNQGQAMLATIGVLVTWCILPAFLHEAIGFVREIGQSLFGVAGWTIFSPVLFLVEPLWRDAWQNWNFPPPRAGFFLEPTSSAEAQFFAFFVHYGVSIAVWLWLMRWGFRSFAKAVRRNEGINQDDADAIRTPPALARCAGED